MSLSYLLRLLCIASPHARARALGGFSDTFTANQIAPLICRLSHSAFLRYLVDVCLLGLESRNSPFSETTTFNLSNELENFMWNRLEGERIDSDDIERMSDAWAKLEVGLERRI